MIPSRRSGVATLVTAALLLLSTAGCTGTPEPPADPAGPPPAMAVATVQAVRSAVVRVAGELASPRRLALARQTRRLVRGYLNAAFLDPASTRDPFRRFTPGARALALRQRDLLTRTGLGAEAVTSGPVTAFLSVLAPQGRATGATVRLSADLTVTRAGQFSALRLTGRLLLTPSRTGWRVFGFDLARSDLANRELS